MTNQGSGPQNNQDRGPGPNNGPPLFNGPMNGKILNLWKWTMLL